MTIIRLCGMIAAGVFLTSCKRVEPIALEDTEGRKFTLGSDEGQVVPLPVESSSRDETFRLERSSYVVGVCPVVASGGTSMGLCRALVCRSDQNCPPAHGLRTGTCINGLCIEPSNTITSTDAVMLCLAGTGAGNSSQTQVERFALGLNCGQPCKVPTPCRQP